MAYRFDTQTFNPNQLRPPWTNADGSTVFDAYLAAERVLTYTRPDGTQRREFRPAEENLKALGLFGLIPVTDEHPPGLLRNLGNADQYKKGITLSDPQFIEKGGYVRCSLAVLDSRLADEMKQGIKNQGSTGYKCDTEETPGIWIDAYGVISPPGTAHHYDAIQRGIIPDHHASTRKGRAGSDIASYIERLDSAADQDVAWAECPTCPPIHQEHSNRTDSECGCKEQPMAEQHFDGGKKRGMMVTLDMGDGETRTYEIDPTNQEQMDMMNSYQKKLDGYQKKLDSVDADLEAALDLIEELQARLDSEPDDSDDGEFEVPEGYVLVDEDWVTPLLEMQENIDSSGSDMHIVDCWQHNESEYAETLDAYNKLVDERVDSVFDEENINAKVTEVIQERLDEYKSVMDLLGKTHMDSADLLAIATEETGHWTAEALRAHGLNPEGRSAEWIEASLETLRATRGDAHDDEEDDIEPVRKKLNELFRPDLGAPNRVDSDEFESEFMSLYAQGK